MFTSLHGFNVIDTSTTIFTFLSLVCTKQIVFSTILQVLKYICQERCFHLCVVLCMTTFNDRLNRMIYLFSFNNI